MSITEFLLARIAEDRAAAMEDAAEMSRSTISIQFDCQTQARFNPERVLTECAAKRTMVEIHRTGIDPCDAHEWWFKSIACDTVRALAAVYKDHPDYRQEWAL